MQALILVGGEGTRLYPLTYIIPKPIVPIVNIPHLIHIFELLKKHKIYDVLLSVYYMPDAIKKYLKDGSDFGMNIVYVEEEHPLGTGGAIKNAEPYINDTFLIFNGDILTDANLTDIIKYHMNKKSKATIALKSVEDPTAYGLVEIDEDGRIQRFLEKPSPDEITTDLINAGIYVFEPEILKYIPPGVNYSVERGLFPMLKEKEEPFYGYPIYSYWIDIGSPQKYRQVHHDILTGKIKAKIKGEQIKSNVWVEKDTRIEEGVDFEGPVVIGCNCQIKKDVTLGPFTTIGNNNIISEKANISECILWNNIYIEKKATLSGCIIGDRCKIEEDATIKGMAVFGENTIITKGSILRGGKDE